MICSDIGPLDASIAMNNAFVKAQRARFDMDRNSGRRNLVTAILIRVGDDDDENKWLDDKIKDGWLDAV